MAGDGRRCSCNKRVTCPLGLPTFHLHRGDRVRSGIRDEGWHRPIATTELFAISTWAWDSVAIAIDRYAARGPFPS